MFFSSFSASPNGYYPSPVMARLVENMKTGKRKENYNQKKNKICF